MDIVHILILKFPTKEIRIEAFLKLRWDENIFNYSYHARDKYKGYDLWSTLADETRQRLTTLNKQINQVQLNSWVSSGFGCKIYVSLRSIVTKILPFSFRHYHREGLDFQTNTSKIHLPTRLVDTRSLIDVKWTRKAIVAVHFSKERFFFPFPKCCLSHKFSRKRKRSISLLTMWETPLRIKYTEKAGRQQ